MAAIAPERSRPQCDPDDKSDRRPTTRRAAEVGLAIARRAGGPGLREPAVQGSSRPSDEKLGGSARHRKARRLEPLSVGGQHGSLGDAGAVPGDGRRSGHLQEVTDGAPYLMTKKRACVVPMRPNFRKPATTAWSPSSAASSRPAGGRSLNPHRERRRQALARTG